MRGFVSITKDLPHNGRNSGSTLCKSSLDQPSAKLNGAGPVFAFIVRTAYDTRRRQPF